MRSLGAELLTRPTENFGSLHFFVAEIFPQVFVGFFLLFRLRRQQVIDRNKSDLESDVRVWRDHILTLTNRTRAKRERGGALDLSGLTKSLRVVQGTIFIRQVK